MTSKEAFRRIEINLSNYLGEGLVNERRMIRQALTELEELKRDVARYFETTDMVEWSELGTKLSKVGKKDDN